MLEHDSNGDGVPDVPAGTVYRELPAYNTLSPQSVSARTEGIVYSTYLYENVSTNEYKIFATLTLQRSPSDDNLELSLGERPLGVIDYNTLKDMDEGESIDVLLINPRNSTRSGRLYYGIGPNGGSAPNGTAWESCGYSSFNGFLARAKAIYYQKSSFLYKDYSYSGPGNNKSGLAGWCGDNDVLPLTSVSDTDKQIFFNYEGKRATYFHTLTKNNGQFSLDGLKVDSENGATSITGLKAISGTKVSGKFPSDLNANYLVEFRNAADETQSLKSDCAWDGTNVDNAKYCKLTWQINNVDTQDHQFILFGKFDSTGGLLKRILKDNNKEVPLTYMSRNEDINVVINVFYAEQNGELSFKVDNTDWTDSGVTQPEHIFK